MTSIINLLTLVQDLIMVRDVSSLKEIKGLKKINSYKFGLEDLISYQKLTKDENIYVI